MFVLIKKGLTENRKLFENFLYYIFVSKVNLRHITRSEKQLLTVFSIIPAFIKIVQKCTNANFSDNDILDKMGLFWEPRKLKYLLSKEKIGNHFGTEA